MKQWRGTLLCAWCVFVKCVVAGGGGAGLGQDAAAASEDVWLAGAAGVTRQTTSRDADRLLQHSQFTSVDETVTLNSSSSVQAPEKAVLGHHGQGKEGQGVSESRVQSLSPSTTKALPPPDVPLQLSGGVVGQGTSHRLNETVQISENVPDETKALLLSSTVSALLSSRGALGNGSQGLTTSSPHPWPPSTASLAYVRTAGADTRYGKQDIARALQENKGLCDNNQGMFMAACKNKGVA